MSLPIEYFSGNEIQEEIKQLNCDLIDASILKKVSVKGIQFVFNTILFPNLAVFLKMSNFIVAKIFFSHYFQIAGKTITEEIDQDDHKNSWFCPSSGANEIAKDKKIYSSAKFLDVSQTEHLIYLLCFNRPMFVN